MKTNTDLIRSNGPGSPQSRSCEEENLWWERFVKQIGFNLGVKE